jgi:predicted dehydrogenase
VTAGLRLAAIVTANPDRQERVKRDHPDAAVLASADELWERAGDYDVAVVAAPNRAHVPLALAAFESGLAVVVDKPLAASADDGRLLIETARERGLLLTVFQNRRWDGDFLTVRALIDEGVLGRVLRFESRFERWRPEVAPGWRERAEPEEAGGLLLDLGSHLVDQALQLFGHAQAVYAELDRRRPGARVDDDVFVASDHVSGVRSHLWASAVAADSGPRFRVLGNRAAYVKHGLDVQERALRSGRRPDDPDWGREPEEHSGVLVADGRRSAIPTRPGNYRRSTRASPPAWRAERRRPLRRKRPSRGLRCSRRRACRTRGGKS